MASSNSTRPTITGVIRGTISLSFTLFSITLILGGGLYLLIVPTTYLANPLAQPYASAAIASMGVGLLLNSRTNTALVGRTGLILFTILCIMYGLEVIEVLPMAFS